MEVITSSAQETFQLGESLAEKLTGGDPVLLFGGLGAGKTELVKGICSGLGYKGRVLSPTFQLAREYLLPRERVAIKKIYHLDLYRLSKRQAESFLDLADYFSDKTALCLVEWAEKLPPAVTPPSFWKIKIKQNSEKERKFVIIKL